MKMQDSLNNNAKKYSKIKHNIAIFEIFFTLLVLFAILATGLSRTIADFAISINPNHFISVAFYLVIFGIMFNAVNFPVDYFSGYILEHRFNLSRQNFQSWLKDYFKKLLISGVFYFIAIEALYIFLRNAADSWWLWTAGFYLFFSLVIARIFPVFIIPLFYKLTKLEDENLRQDILRLTKKANIKILDIYRIGLGEKTRKANAALTGVGSSKRVLFSDTLLDNYTSDEIQVTLAHELAHHKHKHFWKLIFFSFISTLFILYLASVIFRIVANDNMNMAISYIGAFPILAFILALFNVILMPVSAAISRYFEYQADREAVGLTKNKNAFVSLMQKLGSQNLSDPEPSKIVELFFYDHPPTLKRIKAVKNLAL